MLWIKYSCLNARFGRNFITSITLVKECICACMFHNLNYEELCFFSVLYMLLHAVFSKALKQVVKTKSTLVKGDGSMSPHLQKAPTL